MMIHLPTYTESTTVILEAAIYCLVASGAHGPPYIHPGSDIPKGQVEEQGVPPEMGRPG